MIPPAVSGTETDEGIPRDRMISSLPDSDFISGHNSPKNALHSSDGESVNQEQSETTRSIRQVLKISSSTQ